MLMIRLARFGAKKKPFYRVVVIEKERARDSRNLEVVGHYNPLTTPAKIDLKPMLDKLEVYKDEFGKFFIAPRPGSGARSRWRRPAQPWSAP